MRDDVATVLKANVKTDPAQVNCFSVQAILQIAKSLSIAKLSEDTMKLPPIVWRWLLVTFALGAADHAAATLTSAQAYVDLGTGGTVVFHSVVGGAGGAKPRPIKA